jgi:hypothetical protein
MYISHGIRYWNGKTRREKESKRPIDGWLTSRCNVDRSNEPDRSRPSKQAL